MHTYKLLTGATLSLMLAVNAQAAETTDLAIAGTIIPAACTPSFSDGGEVDFGDIQAKSIDQGVNKDTRLGMKEITFKIDCESPTLIGVTTDDNAPGGGISITLPGYDQDMSSHISHMFGFGLSPNGKKIGSYIPIYKAGSYTDGGNPVALISRQIGGIDWTEVITGLPQKGNIRTTSFATPGNLTPIAVQNVSGTIGVTAAISTRDGLTFEDEVSMEGSATYTVVYL